MGFFDKVKIIACTLCVTVALDGMVFGVGSQ